MDSNEMNMHINPIKSGLREYINTVFACYNDVVQEISNNPEHTLYNNIVKLGQIYNRIAEVNTISELNLLREDILTTEQLLSLEYTKLRINSLSGRERALVERGYDLHDVMRLSKFTEEEAQKAAEIIFDRISRDCERVDNPTCIFLGGQPGCGKSTESMEIRATNPKNGIVEIGIDNYRSYHPHYEEMENTIRRYWQDKTPTINSSPGNDIADFTHAFAGRVTDIVTDKACELVDGKAYNIVMEWGMRTPDEPLKRMKEFKENGYTNIVKFIAVHKDVSWQACVLRADVMNNSQRHIIRRVPASFHSLCIDTLPDSCNQIFQGGFVDNSFIDSFNVVDRNGKVLFDSKDNPGKLPGGIYSEVLNNPVYSNKQGNDAEIANLTFYNEAMGFNESLEQKSKLGM